MRKLLSKTHDKLEDTVNKLQRSLKASNAKQARVVDKGKFIARRLLKAQQAQTHLAIRRLKYNCSNDMQSEHRKKTASKRMLAKLCGCKAKLREAMISLKANRHIANEKDQRKRRLAYGLLSKLSMA